MERCEDCGHILPTIGNCQRCVNIDIHDALEEYVSETLKWNSMEPPYAYIIRGQRLICRALAKLLPPEK